MRLVLCIHLAVLGRCSQICKPGSEVAMGLNSPRTSAGAWGFMSNISIWLGPPSRLNRITDLALPGYRLLLCSLALRKPGVVRPKRDSPPACISFLRLNVSPDVFAAPKISSMAIPFCSAIRGRGQRQKNDYHDLSGLLQLNFRESLSCSLLS